MEYITGLKWVESSTLFDEIRFGLLILAHRIRASEFLPWDKKSFLAHAIRISDI